MWKPNGGAGQFAGTLKPDFVIPFKLSREDAIRELKKHYRGKVLLPKSFSKENHLQEIQGVYVPFWLFSGEAEGKPTMSVPGPTSAPRVSMR